MLGDGKARGVMGLGGEGRGGLGEGLLFVRVFVGILGLLMLWALLVALVLGSVWWVVGVWERWRKGRGRCRGRGRRVEWERELGWKRGR